MVWKISAGGIAKWVLLFCGSTLLLAGVIGLLIDYGQDFNIKPENSGTLVIGIGAVILIATIILYIIVPEFRRRQHLDLLRQHYASLPEGELKSISHNIVDKAQAVIWNTEAMAYLCDECSKKDTSATACVEKLSIAKTSLEQATAEMAELKRQLGMLEDRFKPVKD